jgi:hypothetical protein
MNHLSEEILVEAYYEGLPEKEARHLAECEECRALFERQRELLDGLREYPVPERGPGYGGEVWTKLLPRLAQRKEKRAKIWWLLVPAVAAILVVAFLAGRWTERHTPAVEIASIPEKARERVLLLTLSEHLERSQIVLTELANASPGSSDLLEERDRARELVGANRLLRQTAIRLGDRQDAAVLEELEHVLVEVANTPDTPAKGDTMRMQQRIAQNELLFKVRVASTDARERGLRL